MTNKAMLWASKTEDFNTFFSKGYGSTQNNVSMSFLPWSLELQVDSFTISATREAPINIKDIKYLQHFYKYIFQACCLSFNSLYDW